MFVDMIDSTLSSMTEEEKASMRPEIVITLGGAIRVTLIKQYLRNAGVKEHWHVGMTEATIDCLRSLTMNVNMPTTEFFEEIAGALDVVKVRESDYAAAWRPICQKGSDAS